MEKFTKLGLSKEMTDVLKQFGFKEPSEIQERAIPLALAGKDIIGGSATGSGKTLAFASAIIENLKPNKEIQSLILTPTRELAEQVANSIRDFGKNKNLNVLAVYGGVRIESQIRNFSRADIVVGTPGRILDHISRRTLRLNYIKFLVLDEVDRMFDMGFRKDVERIINECPKKRQTMMFSATISQGIDYLSKKYTQNPIEISLKSHIDPSQLKQIYYDVPDNKKFSLLVHLLKKEESNFVLVFCNTRRNVDFVTDNLIRLGIKAKAIHGGLDQRKRLRVLDEFKKKATGVLVCTDVAARGLDIKGISHVYNYDIPTDSKEYIHRIGRTARAGEEGKAITILASRDYEKFGNLIQSGEININSEKLPQLEIVRIKIDFEEKENRFNKNPRRDFNREPRRNNFSRASRRGSSDESKSSNKNSSNKRFGSRKSFSKGKNNFRSSNRYKR
jgi:ATP-dependent RNA helicase DeaD